MATAADSFASSSAAAPASSFSFSSSSSYSASFSSSRRNVRINSSSSSSISTSTSSSQYSSVPKSTRSASTSLSTPCKQLISELVYSVGGDGSKYCVTCQRPVHMHKHKRDLSDKFVLFLDEIADKFNKKVNESKNQSRKNPYLEEGDVDEFSIDPQPVSTTSSELPERRSSYSHIPQHPLTQEKEHDDDDDDEEEKHSTDDYKSRDNNDDDDDDGNDTPIEKWLHSPFEEEEEETRTSRKNRLSHTFKNKLDINGFGNNNNNSRTLMINQEPVAASSSSPSRSPHSPPFWKRFMKNSEYTINHQNENQNQNQYQDNKHKNNKKKKKKEEEGVEDGRKKEKMEISVFDKFFARFGKEDNTSKNAETNAAASTAYSCSYSYSLSSEQSVSSYSSSPKYSSSFAFSSSSSSSGDRKHDKNVVMKSLKLNPETTAMRSPRVSPSSSSFSSDLSPSPSWFAKFNKNVEQRNHSEIGFEAKGGLLSTQDD